MIKILNIGWKDLLALFRDPGALIILLATPFALTLAMGFAFGGFGDDSAMLSDIPVGIVNQDQGQFGGFMVEVFQSDDLATLLEPTVLEDPAEGRRLVDDDELAAVVIVPQDLSDSILPLDLMEEETWSQEDLAKFLEGEPQEIEIYGNPGSPISVSVVRTVVERFIGNVSAGMAAGEVTIGQLIRSGRLSGQEAIDLGQALGQRIGEGTSETTLIEVVNASETREDQDFDLLGYLAPSMAILFLMFTVTAGGRSVLAERREGTLPRMLTTPTSVAQVIGGKMAGIFFSGLAQLLILVVATTLLLGSDWGDPVGVAALILATVAAATGWGMVIAAFSRTPAEASAVGTALSLVFGVASGNFVGRGGLPEWLRQASLIAPNSWALEGFETLAGNGGLVDIVGALGGLLAMFLILFVVSVLAFRRQYV